MVNGLGVLGWGVGGIEAEAAMLGQPVSMLIPRVVGFKLTGAIPTGVTATDVVLTITAACCASTAWSASSSSSTATGVAEVPLANRATIGNMSPEFGSTAAMFPIDEVTLDYLRLTGRSEEQVALVEEYSKLQHLWHDPSVEPVFSEYLELDLAHGRAVDRRAEAPAGPHRAHATRRRSSRTTSSTTRSVDAVDGRRLESRHLPGLRPDRADARGRGIRTRPATTADQPPAPVRDERVARADHRIQPDEGAASRTGRRTPSTTAPSPSRRSLSCTNTSNPCVMLAAGLLARNAAQKGLKAKPWVKTTLAPGSKVVTDYYEKAGLTDDLEALGFYTVGYGCTTCIGNSGPLLDEVSAAVNQNDLAVTAVLSGNRNFEGRINPDVKMNYLASPPLVIAYALAGSMNFDFESDALGQDQRRQRRLPQGHLARCGRGAEHDRLVDRHRACSPTSTPASSTATSAGRRSRRRPARRSSGTPTRPTCANPRTSTA